MFDFKLIKDIINIEKYWNHFLTVLGLFILNFYGKIETAFLNFLVTPSFLEIEDDLFFYFLTATVILFVY